MPKLMNILSRWNTPTRQHSAPPPLHTLSHSHSQSLHCVPELSVWLILPGLEIYHISSHIVAAGLGCWTFHFHEQQRSVVKGRLSLLETDPSIIQPYSVSRPMVRVVVYGGLNNQCEPSYKSLWVTWPSCALCISTHPNSTLRALQKNNNNKCGCNKCSLYVFCWWLLLPSSEDYANSLQKVLKAAVETVKTTGSLCTRYQTEWRKMHLVRGKGKSTGSHRY